MALTTGFTRLFGVRHPIGSAPMGGSAGGALAAAVSRGGGFGMVGGGDREWLDRELPIAAAQAGGPWGVGFLTWSATPEVVQQALAYGPSAVMLRSVIPPLPVWAGEGVDLIVDAPSAADLVGALAAEAEVALARAGRG